MRPQQTTKINCSVNAYHISLFNIHRCLQTTTPTFMPTLFSSRPAQTLYTSLPTFVKFNHHNTYIQIASVLQYSHLYICMCHCVPDSAIAIQYSCTAVTHQRFIHVHAWVYACSCFVTDENPRGRNVLLEPSFLAT